MVRNSNPAYVGEGSFAIVAVEATPTAHVRFAPKATVGNQTVIRSFVPLPDSCSAAKSDHSIISSARVSSVAGSSRPSASAVLRLMNSSIFVDCWTGKLASFSSFRTRPV